MLGLSLHHAKLAIAHLISGTLAGVAVAMCIYAKIKTKQGIKADDIFILLTLLFYYGAIVTLYTNFGPFSTDIKIIAKEESVVRLRIYRKAMLAAFLLAMTAQCTCKISILVFYRRIFSASKFHQDISLGLMVFATTSLLSAIMASLCICRPLKLIWYPEEQREGAKRGEWATMVFFFLVTDVLTDLAILVLPMRTAFTLQMPIRARIGVMGIFALGWFVVVTNAVRIELIDPHEVYFSRAELWTTIHICAAVLCASIPIYKPLWMSVSKAIRLKVMGALLGSGKDEQSTVQESKSGQTRL